MTMVIVFFWPQDLQMVTDRQDNNLMPLNSIPRHKTDLAFDMPFLRVYLQH